MTKDWPVAEADFFYRTMRALDRAFTAHGTEHEELPPDAVESDNPARDAFRSVMRSMGS